MINSTRIKVIHWEHNPPPAGVPGAQPILDLAFDYLRRTPKERITALRLKWRFRLEFGSVQILSYITEQYFGLEDNPALTLSDIKQMCDWSYRDFKAEFDSRKQKVNLTLDLDQVKKVPIDYQDLLDRYGTGE